MIISESTAKRRIRDIYQSCASNVDYDIENQIKRFQSVSRPDEYTYLVDAKSVELILVSEPKNKNLEFKRLDNLYDHIFKNQQDRVLSFWSEKLVKYGMEEKMYDTQTVFGFVYKTNTNRVLLKETGLALGDEYLNPLCTYGRIKDITEWVHPNQAFRWYVNGPVAKLFYAHVHDLQEMAGLLGNRELEILKLVADGYTSKQIGELLFISKHTVDTHRRAILKKLEVKGSFEALKKAQDIGIL